MKRHALRLSVLIGCLLTGLRVMGQPYVAEKFLPEEDNFFLGITILGNPSLRFSTISDYQNGVSVNHATVKVSTLGLAWSLDVRATDDLYYQTHMIPISGIGLLSTNLGSQPEIFLKKTNQTLASGLVTFPFSQNITIRYRALGGTNFLKPGGTYTTTLVFTYAGL